MNLRPSLRALMVLAATALLMVPSVGRAQWLTQTNELKAGWNAVFLHVDAGYTNLNELVGNAPGNQILEIWRWNPASGVQFVANQAEPVSGPEWSTWKVTNPNSVLQTLSGDTAYLVKVGSNVSTYSWRVKGKAVAPRQDWTISGLNLIGFSTVPVNPPNFKNFLSQATQLQTGSTEVYYYQGGEITNNPVALASPLMNLIPVVRGQAYWVRSGTAFNRYFGPFEVVQSSRGLDFGDSLSSSTFRLRNLSTNTLTVTARLTASEASPSGQVYSVPPLLLRGSVLSFTNLVYGYTNLPVNTPRTWTLAPRNTPGSEIEVAVGLNRTAITDPAGTFFAAILSFTDSLNFTRVQLPVSATAASRAGLWVGGAELSQVGHYLKSYAVGAVTNRSGNQITVTTNALLTTNNGNYIVTSVNTNLGSVPRPYPVRLIVHNPASGNATLLQQVYHGVDGSTNLIVSTGESALHPAYLKSARRISSSHLPWTTNHTTWPMSGRFGTSTNLTTTVTVPYDDQASNPFLHTYHPDHDNLDSRFKKVLAQGSESYRIERSITLTLLPPGDDFSSLVSSATQLAGEYLEVVTLKGLARSGGTNDTRRFETRGSFVLNRVSDVPTLTVAP